MPDPLRFLLLLLVLLDLAFVQVTGTVDPAWLAALWIATAVSPLLAGFRERFWYRTAWNGAVLCAFTFLLQHALTTGLLHMLEDGLVLAALCQVHLLNNVSRRQRPDLLFFNSFLIAFVTSFFSHDLGWSLCFVGYAALLVPALQLYVSLPGDAAPAPGTVCALLRDSAPRSALALLLTATAFALWPRDFRHEGWLDDTLRLAGTDMVAFTEEIRLDRSTVPTLSDATVLRVRPAAGGADAVPSHWRGITFVQFDGCTWRPFEIGSFGAPAATDVAWRAAARRTWRRPADLRDGGLAVTLLDTSGGRFFLPQQAAAVEVAPDEPVLLEAHGDGVLAFAPGAPRPAAVHATVRTGAFGPQFRPRTTGSAAATLRQLPSELPQTLLLIADEIRRRERADASDREIVEITRSWLETKRRYALPGTAGAARNLGEFLLGTGGGHCEYFATALALLLRLQDVPCRVVGGYLAHEWDAEHGEMVVRQRDAHAWVEALLADGWVTVDATPPAALELAPAATSWWESLTQSVTAAWRAVTSYDEVGRQRLSGWLCDALWGLLERPYWIAVPALAVAAALRWRRRGQPATVVALHSALRSARVRQLPGETPRELLARTAVVRMSARRRERLAAAVAAHEAARYRGAAD